MWLAFIGLALAGKWEGKVADIVAERSLPAAPSAVWAVLRDTSRLQQLYPDDCARWARPFDRNAVGGKTIVTYMAGGMTRKLDAVLLTLVPDTRLDLDHLGNKGFVTRFQLSPEGTGTKVVMTTHLNPPPGIIAGYFYNKVQPAWAGCHARTLERLETAVQ